MALCAGPAHAGAMEYLVTMTTHVPPGTSDAAVDDMRAREAVRARELAAHGTLVRLWRPPLQPGEWRSFGLFAAEDAAGLEKTLASMPLRVWRTDEVEALAPHPNDPFVRLGRAVSYVSQEPEFLTRFTVRIPADAPPETAAARLAGEAERTRELTDQGHLVRLWRLSAQPGVSRALGLWRATDAAQMRAIADALPLAPWMTTDITTLSRHPSDPAAFVEH